VKHQNYPDKDIVRVALTDARKERFGPLVEGRSGQKTGLSRKTNRCPVEDGWMLTPRGVEWIQGNLVKLERIVGDKQTKDHRQRILKQLKLIRGHSLFVRYIDNPENFAPAIGEIAEMLRCRVDAEQEVWIDRFMKAELLAKSAGQQDVSNFLERCQKAYLEQK
jgi:hypothetical protein